MKQAQREAEDESRAEEIPPGPNAGRIFRDPPRCRRDAVTGRLVRQLTNYRGHSHHWAGREPCWLDGGRRLVVVSDRDGCGNLFAYDFAEEALTQLTDLRGMDRPERLRLSPGERLAFFYGGIAYGLELKSLRIRAVNPAFSVEAGRNTARRLQTGDVAIAGGGRAIWIGEGAGPGSAPRVAAIADGSGRWPFGATAPCVRPGGAQIVFASEVGGYAQVCAVGVGRSEGLPRLADLQRSGPWPSAAP